MAAAAPINVIVTGANRGIGKALCNLILQDTSIVGPTRLFATTRQGTALNFALRDASTQEVVYPALDIEEPESVKAFAEQVRERTRDGDGAATGVNVLINNAGIYLKNSGPDAYATARKTMDVNYFGTRNMCEQFIPQMAPNGRIVNLSSVASQIRDYGEIIHSRFRSDDITFSELDEIIDNYLQALKNLNPSSSDQSNPDLVVPLGREYGFSKSCINVLTRLYAAQHKNLLINCCCPGWVNTDMGAKVGPKPPKKPDEGALIPFNLAFGDIAGVSGKYWANSSPRGKGKGEVMAWAEDGSLSREEN